MHTTPFITVAIVGALAVISPGPDFVLVVRNSLLYSRRAGFHTTAGIVLGNLWWVAASITGISCVIAKSPAIFSTLKLAGALYLVYLGCKALTAKADTKTMHSATGKTTVITAADAFKMGLFTNLSNPKAALFFISFFSAFITPGTSVLTRYFYGTEIVLIALLWFALLAALLSLTGVRTVFTRASTLLERCTGAVLFC